MKQYWVYILASKSGVLYIGVTSDITRRIYQHKNRSGSRFTAKYNVNRLVYVEETSDIMAALNREKQLKGWIRRKKVVLIESLNPEWNNLSEGWYKDL
jgi:putative endonuclease